MAFSKLASANALSANTKKFRVEIQVSHACTPGAGGETRARRQVTYGPSEKKGKGGAASWFTAGLLFDGSKTLPFTASGPQLVACGKRPLKRFNGVGHVVAEVRPRRASPCSWTRRSCPSRSSSSSRRRR